MRLRLALLSALLGLVLPLLAGVASERIAARSDCEELDCLGVFLVSLAVGLLVSWAVWDTVARLCGQRFAVLVPPLAVLTAWSVPPVLAPLLSPLSVVPFVSALGLQLGLIGLAGAGWAAALGPRRPRTTPGYGEVLR